MALHQPLRVYVLNIDGREAYDTVILDEVQDIAETVGYTSFEMLPCLVESKAFNVVKSARDYEWQPVSMRTSSGEPLTYGNILLLGYDVTGHRSLTDEEVIYIENHITMNVRFRYAANTTYVVNDAALLRVYDKEDEE